MFKVEMFCDEVLGSSRNYTDAEGYADGDCEVRISNPDAENGVECSGPLSWMNSAAININTQDDSVTCSVSVGDPRGAFGFTVRRCPDGTLIIHTPYPGEGFPHMATKFLHPGTLIVGHYDPKSPDNFKGPADFSDPPESEEQVDDDEE